MITINFEVILEGPTGGVWLWSVMGLGIASMHVYDHKTDFTNDSITDLSQEVTFQSPILSSDTVQK